MQIEILVYDMIYLMNLWIRTSFLEQVTSAYVDAEKRGFDSIIVAIDTDLDTTYYINDTPDGFQCDLWDYYFDDLETIASQLYNEMHGSVTEIRIE